MKRILIVASVTGYQTRVFAETAKRLGFEPVLATDQCHRLDDPWRDGAITVRFHNPVRWAGEIVAHGPFDGIVALGDRPVFLAALAAQRFGIPYSAPAAVEACGNKYLARERFRIAGLSVPDYFRVPIADGPREAAARAPYPCVLKPLGLSASRGVIRADNAAGFAKAFERIRAMLESAEIRSQRDPESAFLQVEAFIPGREFALEGIVTAGCLQTLALFDKPDPLDGPFFEETIYVTPSRESAAVQNEIVETTQRAVSALGLTRGPLHAEMRVNGDGVWMLEVAARPIGGLCARALRFDAGMTLEELVLRHAAGEDVSGACRELEASGVMMIPVPRVGIYEDAGGLEEARCVPGVEEVILTAKPGQKLVPLPEGASYLGFIFARGGSPAEVEAALRDAHKKLGFRIATALPLV
jgi:biotin carboxylase